MTHDDVSKKKQKNYVRFSFIHWLVWFGSVRLVLFAAQFIRWCPFGISRFLSMRRVK